MPYEYELALEIMNYIFASIFNIECGLKLSAWGKSYFVEVWNK